MDVIQTLSSGKELLKLQKEMAILAALRIKGVRFNLCKFRVDEYEEILLNIKKATSIYGDRFELLFDLPYPKNKARIRSYSIKEGIVVKGEEYIIERQAEEIIGEKTIYVEADGFDEALEIDDIIYFGDGEGVFVIREIQKSFLVVEALNDFKICLNKGITCGYVSNIKQCMDCIALLSSMFKRRITLLLSFLQTEEIDYLVKNLDREKLHIIPKIELVNDIGNIPEVINKSDGALLARGDMGLLNSPRDLLEICRAISQQTGNDKKRLLVATDILSAYKYREFPSRADLLDLCVFNELNCTDVVLFYPISKHIVQIINLLSTFDKDADKQRNKYDNQKASLDAIALD